MINAELLPAVVLQRKAVVYVRQSTQAQVQMNLESQRRQYDLVGEARRLGFRDIEVIDDDLGRSATGTVARPGFEKLVAWLCAGEVGAVLCLGRIPARQEWTRLASFAGALRFGRGASDRSGRCIRSVSRQRSVAPGNEGEYQRIRNKRAAFSDVRGGSRQGPARRVTNQRADRLCLAS